MALSDDVDAYYRAFPEELRLGMGPFTLEFARTKDLLSRHLPPAPARILDVGGAAGAYSAWLADRGYEVHLVDASSRLVDEARRRNAGAARPIASFTVGDARTLSTDDASMDAVLVMGPLYHLTSVDDRLTALQQAHRTLVPGGVLAATAISRFASALQGLLLGASADPVFAAICARDLADGQHRNPTNHPHYFTTAYFHKAEDLHDEIARAGFSQVDVFGIEGPGWLVPNFEERWADAFWRQQMIGLASAIEAEPSIVGASAHLLGVARKP